MEPVIDPEFIAEHRALEPLYLSSDDDLRRSGYSAGPERWTAERSPLVDGIDRDGTFLDVGCANGRLAEDVVRWAAERGHRIEAYGVDLGPRLIELARRRFPGDRFVAADAWEWDPGRRWTFVYAMLDQAPDDMACVWFERLAGWVEPGGRLIVGDYGSRHRGVEPRHVAEVLADCGFDPIGTAAGGEPVVTRFAWVAVPG